jgi:hypothetical protein
MRASSLTFLLDAIGATRRDDAVQHRLVRVLDAVRTRRIGRSTEVGSPLLPRLDPSRLDATLEALAELQERARRAGAFIDLWTVAGLKRDEVRTAAVLGWILDPRGSHGAGDAFLQAFWRRLGGDVIFELRDPERCLRELCSLGDEQNRIDLVIDARDSIVFIEVKIDASPGQEQLTRYAAAAKARARALGKRNYMVVYLAQRLEPRLPDGCVQITWHDVAVALRSGLHSVQRHSFVGEVVLQYARHVERLH